MVPLNLPMFLLRRRNLYCAVRIMIQMFPMKSKKREIKKMHFLLAFSMLCNLILSILLIYLPAAPNA